jgi:molybdate transport repressor ModE-like protein
VATRHYFKELRLQQFRGLQAIIRLGSFSAAARQLGLTKASVWQQVRALEEEFGCRLIEAIGRRAQPTPDGIRLARLSSPLVEGFDSIKSAFEAERASMNGPKSRSWIFFCSPSIRSPLSPQRAIR